MGGGIKVKAITVKPFSGFLNGQQRQLGSGPFLLDFTRMIHISHTYFLQRYDKTLQDL